MSYGREPAIVHDDDAGDSADSFHRIGRL